MERLTFEGNFCDISLCINSRCSAVCSQRKVWERLKHYEDMEAQGRLVVLDEETALAVAAVTHGCNTNPRLVGASYMRNIHSDNPKQISYYRAIGILTEIADKALKEGADQYGLGKDEEDQQEAGKETIAPAVEEGGHRWLNGLEQREPITKDGSI